MASRHWRPSQIEGVAAGRRLKAFGRIGMRGGDRVIYNPRYELEA